MRLIEAPIKGLVRVCYPNKNERFWVVYDSDDQALIRSGFGIFDRDRDWGGQEVEEGEAEFDLKVAVENYFEGGTEGFGQFVYKVEGTDFQKQVWQELIQVRYGQRASYSKIAKRMASRAYQAVGQACSVNPLPIFIPCHRIVAKSGQIGGFSFDLGIKKRLLALELEKSNE